MSVSQQHHQHQHQPEAYLTVDEEHDLAGRCACVYECVCVCMGMGVRGDEENVTFFGIVWGYQVLRAEIRIGTARAASQIGP